MNAVWAWFLNLGLFCSVIITAGPYLLCISAVRCDRPSYNMLSHSFQAWDSGHTICFWYCILLWPQKSWYFICATEFWHGRELNAGCIMYIFFGVLGSCFEIVHDLSLQYPLKYAKYCVQFMKYLHYRLSWPYMKRTYHIKNTSLT